MPVHILRLLGGAANFTRQKLHEALSARVVPVARGLANLPRLPGRVAATLPLGHTLKLVGCAFVIHNTSFAVARWARRRRVCRLSRRGNSRNAMLPTTFLSKPKSVTCTPRGHLPCCCTYSSFGHCSCAQY